MKLLNRLIDWIDDSINPIVVKELRQAVQGKFISGILILFLVTQMIAISANVGSRYNFENLYVGRDVAAALFFLLMGACIVCVPAYSGFRFSSERSETDSDLLFITTITPGSIIRGKFLASLAVAGLFYAAAMPFITLTYFLRGIDLPTIFAVLVYSIFPVCLSIMMANFSATLPATNTAARMVAGVVGLMILFWVFGITYEITNSLIRNGIFSRLSYTKYWAETLMAFLGLGFFIGLFYVVSVAFITPPTANKALPFRLFMTGAWTVSGIASVALAVSFSEPEYVTAWSWLSIFLFSVTYLQVICERDVIGNRVARAIPKNYFLGNLAFLFYSGAAGGILWVTAHLVATGVIESFVADLMHATSRYSHKEMAPYMIGMALYSLDYSLTAAFIRRKFLADRFESDYNWFLACLLAGIGGSVPFAIGNIVFASEDEMWLLANPFILNNNSYRGVGLSFAFLWLLAIGLMSMPWLVQQLSDFKRKADPRETIRIPGTA